MLDALPTATTLFFPFGAGSSGLRVGVHMMLQSLGLSGVRVDGLWLG